MPKSSSLLLISTFIIFSSASNVYANTDPQYATPSATANVPSTTSSISPGDTTAPSTPILIAPVDGTASKDSRPEFTWGMSNDPNGNTVTYTFYLNGVASYLGISNVGNSAGVGYTSRIDGSEIKLTPTDSFADGQYNWYVVATDPSNNSSASTQWSYVIDTQNPNISITDIDTYHGLLLNSESPEDFAGLNFDINGSKDVSLTIHSEPSSTLSMQILDVYNNLVSQTSWQIDSSGISHPHANLLVGTYTFNISSYDHAGNTTALPSFTITILEPHINIPLPEIPGLPPSYNIQLPTTPTSSLPASISQIESRSSIANILTILLALGVLLMLISIWKKKPNLYLTDTNGNPLSNTIVYHSIPTNKSNLSQILVSTHAPLSFKLTGRDFGMIHIPKLNRYSTLTIRTSSSTYILSISRKAKQYKLTL